MKTSWVIKGVPSYADDGMIIKTLAQSCNQWPGWVVRPERPLTSTRGKYTTWLVEAAGQPPMETVLLNKQLISIEKYAEKPTQGARANAWFKITATPRHEIAPGQIDQEEYMDASDDISVDDNETQKPDTKTKLSHTEEEKKDGRDILMQEEPEQEESSPSAKRRNNVTGGPSKSQPMEEKQPEENATVAFLKKMLEQKDEQMRGMQATIEALNERLGKMQETLDRMER